jgi:hypothetical protein
MKKISIGTESLPNSTPLYKSFEITADTFYDQAVNLTDNKKYNRFKMALRNRNMEIESRELLIKSDTPIIFYLELSEAYAGALDILENLISINPEAANLELMGKLLDKQKILINFILQKDSENANLHRREFEFINSKFLYLEKKLENCDKDTYSKIWTELESTYQLLHLKSKCKHICSWSKDKVKKILKNAGSVVELSQPKDTKIISKDQERAHRKRKVSELDNKNILLSQKRSNIANLLNNPYPSKSSVETSKTTIEFNLS